MTALSKACCTEKGRKFDAKLKIFRQGKELIVDEWIQSGKQGTNIYDVIEAYGLDYAMSSMGIAGLKTIQEDVSQIHGLQDLKMIEKKANETWEKLPLDFRQQFGNSKSEFVKNGKKWLDAKISEMEKAYQNQKQKQAEQPTSTNKPVEKGEN